MANSIQTFFTLLTVLVLMTPFAAAVNVDPSQENIVMTIERGGEFEFPMIIENLDEDIVISSSGDIASWIKFGNDADDEVTLTGGSYLGRVLVLVKVPEDAELDEYRGQINADDSRLSKVTVKVTVKLSNAQSYDELSDIDQEVGSLRDRLETLTDSLIDMRTQMTALEDEVSNKMEKIEEYQKDLAGLETENQELKQSLAELESRSEELEESNQQLNAMTGMLVSYQVPGMFMGGLIIGIIAVTLLVKRAHVYRKIRKAAKGGERASQEPKEDKFRYHYKP